MVIIFVLGIICGLLLACFVTILLKRYETPLQRKITQLMNSPIMTTSGRRAYIAGLSDEESKFLESLPMDKEVHII
jgi:uncharacterized protein YacL